MNFRRGQKVVCVKASKDLMQDEIYTISSCFGDEAVTLKEVNPTDGCIGFWKWRFRPVNDEWADKVLNKILEEIKADELQLEPIILNTINNE